MMDIANDGTFINTNMHSYQIRLDILLILHILLMVDVTYVLMVSYT